MEGKSESENESSGDRDEEDVSRRNWASDQIETVGFSYLNIIL